MRVFERFAHFRIHGLATDAHVRRRPEEVQDSCTRGALPGAVSVHHIGVFVAALVANVSNERQRTYLFFLLLVAAVFFPFTTAGFFALGAGFVDALIVFAGFAAFLTALGGGGVFAAGFAAATIF